ncbi:MFS transporter [Labedella phragmitis]|uniref:MFS transporter n=1 Tax=Labedella phragmitis TaxID=2498849 RepID=A0A3S4DG75_9MICO|nr:MFS transporter [Labedella phragmitis]RWZ51037.1 MFS transporter [Labedella phragmitis]
MKRAFLFGEAAPMVLVAAGTGLIAATYGLIRLAYGLLLPDVRGDLPLGLDVAGAISGGASVVYCVGALVGFLAAAKYPRMLVLVATGSAGLGAAGMAIAPTATLFGVAAVVSSAGAGIASPALVALLGRNLSGRSLPRFQAVVNAGTGPGLAVAGILALVLLPHWRAAWWVSTAVTLVVGVVVVLADRGSAAGPTTTRPSEHGGLPPRSWYRAHARVIVAALLMGFGSAAVWTYTRTVLIESGAGETVSVVAWIALGAGGAVVIVSSRWTNGVPPSRMWAMTAALIAIASAAIGAGSARSALVLVACVAFGWAYTAGSGALIGWTAQIDAARAPTGTALLFVVLILGQAVGAVVAGLLVVAGGYPLAFLVAGAASAGAAVLAFVRASTARNAGE